MRHFWLLKPYMGFAFLALSICIMPWGKVAVAEDAQYRSAGGLAVYLGGVPVEIIKGHPPDVATGARVSDASVAAQVFGLGLSGPTRKLEPMEIATTTTYGGFFKLSGSDLYTVRLAIRRDGEPRPIVLDFKYDHRR